MTPTDTAILWATPACPARLVKRDGQHGVHYTCLERMRYVWPANEWHCPCCGLTMSASAIMSVEAA
jgi:hypothetical protein